MLITSRLLLVFLVGSSLVACSEKSGGKDAASNTNDLLQNTNDGGVNDLSRDLEVLVNADLAGADLQNAGNVDLAPLGDPVDPLQITRDKNESNYVGDAYAWLDADNLPRSVLLTHNTQKDPANHWGGVARRMTYEHDGTTRNCVGNLAAHPGFGKIISHYDSTSTGSNTQGTYTRVLAGRHHAIHRYQWTIGFGSHGSAAVTVEWLFANGRNHPVYAVTYDTTGHTEIEGDSRSPYGDIQWDYGQSADVEGVGWGDHYKFRTVGAPVCKKPGTNGSCNCSMNGEGNGTCWTWDGWDYAATNTVPHAFGWIGGNTNAEMGLVQTQTYAQHEAGGYWFYGNWGKNSGNSGHPLMAEDYNWAYQLNQYELPYNGGIKSKRIAWGMNFGAVGQNSYNAIGSEAGGLDGFPYQSYAVYVVLGAHSRTMVDAQVGEVETVQGVALTASKGTVRTTGPAGVGRSDTKTYAPVGWNPVYGTWEIDANNDDEAALSLVVPAGKTIVNPVFVVHGFGAASATLSLGGAALAADVDYLVSVDATTTTAWITLRRSLPAGTYAIAIAP